MIAGMDARLSKIENFAAICDAYALARDELTMRREVVHAAEKEVPILAPPTPPLVRRMQLACALPPDVRTVGEQEFGPACLLGRVSDDEASSAWRELRAHQRALEQVECDLRIPEMRASAHRAWVAAEAAWEAMLAVEPPTLACAIRKLEAIMDRSDLYEELLVLRDDLTHLQEENLRC